MCGCVYDDVCLYFGGHHQTREREMSNPLHTRIIDRQLVKSHKPPPPCMRDVDPGVLKIHPELSAHNAESHPRPRSLSAAVKLKGVNFSMGGNHPKLELLKVRQNEAVVPDTERCRTVPPTSSYKRRGAISPLKRCHLVRHINRCSDPRLGEKSH